MFFRKECFLQMPHDALKVLSLTAQGVAQGVYVRGSFRAVSAKAFAPTGRLLLPNTKPRAMPWAMCLLAFQAVYLITTLAAPSLFTLGKKNEFSFPSLNHRSALPLA